MAAILSQYSTTGFYKAPVSKGLLGSIFLTSCALNVPLFSHVRQYMVYSVPKIFENYEVWRLLASKLTFLDTKDVVSGSLLVYYFRIFERRYGSHKFASYLLTACTVATILELSVFFSLFKLGYEIPQIPSGPYGLIIPLFINYFLDIPRVPTMGKALTYLTGLQLIGGSKGALITSLCSLAAGLICRFDFFNLKKKIRIPGVLAKASSVTLGKLLVSSPPANEPLGATMEIQRQQQMEMLDQQMLMREIQAANQSRQNMAQGYAERLVPPNEPNNQGFFGSWEAPSFLRRRTNIPTPPPLPPSSLLMNGQPSTSRHAAPPPPDAIEEQVQTLVEMGFERQNVVRALQNSNNDITLATTILLNES